MIPGKQVERFVKLAESLKPELKRTKETPLGVVKVEKDESALMGWKAVEAGSVEDVGALKAGEEVIYDFEPADAPCRMKLVFGEVLNDVAESFDDYKAWISASWLPDEIINVDDLSEDPQHIYMPRRHAFRYVKISIISTSPRYGVKISNPTGTAVTSAPVEDPPALTFRNAGQNLSEEDKAELRKIDEVALRTLRSCMHTVYEDGPRRDMRLWIGDLRLQALCSYATFKDYNLAKRCLYLFAGLPFDDEGLLCACIYEKPKPYFGGNSIVDYAMLFTVTLVDYVEATGDQETGKELFHIAAKQFEFFTKNFTEALEYKVENKRADEGGVGWHFIDWEPKLQKDSAEHAIMIFCLKSLSKLSALLSLPTPTYIIPASKSLQKANLDDIVSTLIAAHNKNYYDAVQGVYVSGDEKQISWAGNAWAVIAGIPESKEVSQKAMKAAYENPATIKGQTPYLHHYLVEAFILADLSDLALNHIKSYWGSMVKAGGETFFEAWDPSNPRSSPYGDLHSNSFCHAWSCTPALLLRQMGFS